MVIKGHSRAGWREPPGGSTDPDGPRESWLLLPMDDVTVPIVGVRRPTRQITTSVQAGVTMTEVVTAIKLDSNDCDKLFCGPALPREHS